MVSDFLDRARDVVSRHTDVTLVIVAGLAVVALFEAVIILLWARRSRKQRRLIADLEARASSPAASEGGVDETAPPADWQPFFGGGAPRAHATSAGTIGADEPSVRPAEPAPAEPGVASAPPATPAGQQPSPIQSPWSLPESPAEPRDTAAASAPQAPDRYAEDDTDRPGAPAAAAWAWNEPRPPSGEAGGASAPHDAAPPAAEPLAGEPPAADARGTEASPGPPSAWVNPEWRGGQLAGPAAGAAPPLLAAEEAEPNGTASHLGEEPWREAEPVAGAAGPDAATDAGLPPGPGHPGTGVWEPSPGAAAEPPGPAAHLAPPLDTGPAAAPGWPPVPAPPGESVAAPITAGAGAAGAPVADAEGHPGELLIVEDDENVAKLYRLLLESRGYRVRHASDGIEGMDRAVEQTPDLILLDVMMPRMNGITFLQTLRSVDALRDVPVVVLSNFKEPRLVERAMALGALEYMVKAQARPDALVGAIPRWLRGERAFSI